MSGAKESASANLVEAVVARGRSVIDGTGERRLAGEVAKVPASEVKSLREFGFLVDPKAAEIPVQKGPKITPSDGPSMVRLA